MNPFTRFLQQWAPEKDLDAFVQHCDALQRLIIRVYKQGEATAADEAEYQALRRWMAIHYGAWRDELGRFWQTKRAGDEQRSGDPFEAMFSAERAFDFAGAWGVMQQLPDAREALNRLILHRSAER